MEFNFGLGTFTPNENGFTIKLNLMGQDIRIKLTEPSKGWRDYTMLQVGINENSGSKFTTTATIRIPDVKPIITEPEKPVQEEEIEEDEIGDEDYDEDEDDDE